MDSEQRMNILRIILPRWISAVIQAGVKAKHTSIRTYLQKNRAPTAFHMFYH